MFYFKYMKDAACIFHNMSRVCMKYNLYFTMEIEFKSRVIATLERMQA